MNGWAIFATIAVAIIAAFITIWAANRSTAKIGERTASAITESTNKMIQAERELGVQCIEKDIEATVKAIQANGQQTMANIEAVVKAIQANGQQTRQAIKNIADKKSKS